jgi:hypothetical protein
VALAVLAVLPMVAIPNHRIEMYSWYGASILLLVVALLATEAPRLPVLTRLGVFVLVSVSLFAIARGSPVLRSWYSFSQTANANTLAALRVLPSRLAPGERVLFIGRFNAHSPFKNDAFIASRFPYELDWTVAFAPADKPLIEMARDTKRFKQVAGIDLQQFDRVVAFTPDGRLGSVFHRLPADTGDVSSLFCSPRLNPAVDSALLACMNEIGQHASVIALAKSKTEPLDQWEYYALGSAYERTGDVAAAAAAYAEANRIEPAPVFAEALGRVTR